jgi:hypothetical protein
MLVCRRCTTENPEGAAKCSYCDEVLGSPAPSQEPAWGLQHIPQYQYLDVPSASREGARVFLPHGSALPDRCVKCNAPAGGFRQSARLTYLHPAYLLLLIPGIFPYLLASAFARKHADVSVGLCVKHRRARAWTIAAGVASGLVGGVLLVFGLGLESGPLLASGFGLLIAGVVGGGASARVVKAKRIDTTGVLLAGANGAYLNELPARTPPG